MLRCVILNFCNAIVKFDSIRSLVAETRHIPLYQVKNNSKTETSKVSEVLANDIDKDKSALTRSKLHHAVFVTLLSTFECVTAQAFGIPVVPEVIKTYASP
ncbi:protein of unknown function [Taphrina deformans PYCC 5710]|uniref:Uncharacterized protein n=1 Tax=Taphrina deformans (strain PYCC 5710 / ATCC 11124 / CBS 356.35 / IMI 108563 / JCM 9778 / NBRC 8474) TaxID=1097556 RepID=R4XC78_TAPDE|nr:protein of unknown function [Taphrina deformans PYCC 5710]|eukprot:CCG83426.1 protein of unknown function [Taphrina deformans PYCC 5710]